MNPRCPSKSPAVLRAAPAPIQRALDRQIKRALLHGQQLAGLAAKIQHYTRASAKDPEKVIRALRAITNRVSVGQTAVTDPDQPSDLYLILRRELVNL